MAGAAGRLTGTLLGVKSIPSLPLSAEGQAHRLIGEATDKENLGSMYIWCADCHTLNLAKVCWFPKVGAMVFVNLQLLLV